MQRESLLPEKFGPLQDVRVISSGSLIAAPFAAHLMAELGAEVIQVERPGKGDVGWRELGMMMEPKPGLAPVSTSWVQERRNALYVTLDMAKPRGRELFLKLLAEADIWIESSKPGTYNKWQLDDATVLAHNPKLVITHVSGYGQVGDPEYSRRASYDIVAQAYGGTMYQTGFPDPEAPVRAAPWTGDYITAYFNVWTTLAALTYARSTGKGQSIDVAQFEAMHKTLGGSMIEYFQKGFVRERSGNKAQGFQPLDAFAAKDGWIVIGAASDVVFARLLKVIELDVEDKRWFSARVNLESIEGIEFDAILRGWVAERTVEQVSTAMNEAQVPCSKILNTKDIAENSHYKARQVHVEWEDLNVGRVKGIGVAPKFSLTPAKIWRGSVPVGYDNELVYGKVAGLSAKELAELKEHKVL